MLNHVLGDIRPTTPFCAKMLPRISIMTGVNRFGLDRQKKHPYELRERVKNIRTN